MHEIINQFILKINDYHNAANTIGDIAEFLATKGKEGCVCVCVCVGVILSKQKELKCRGDYNAKR